MTSTAHLEKVSALTLFTLYTVNWLQFIALNDQLYSVNHLIVD